MALWMVEVSVRKGIVSKEEVLEKIKKMKIEKASLLYGALSFSIFPRYLGPGVAQGDDAVEDKLVIRGINRVHAEITEPFELVSAPWGCLCQAWLNLA